MSAVRLADTTLPQLVRDHLARSVPASATGGRGLCADVLGR